MLFYKIKYFSIKYSIFQLKKYGRNKHFFHSNSTNSNLDLFITIQKDKSLFFMKFLKFNGGFLLKSQDFISIGIVKFSFFKIISTSNHFVSLKKKSSVNKDLFLLISTKTIFSIKIHLSILKFISEKFFTT
jgi:hypothetical protein